MTDLKKAELIEGIVFLGPRVRLLAHGTPHSHVGWWLGAYHLATPGLITALGTSVRLDLENEFQPDVLLMIDPERGGQARISEDDLVESSPELVAEVCSSSVSIENHLKLHVYRRSGVREYIVWRIRDREIDWFVLRNGDFARLELDADGCYRSGTFPGLWLDAKALARGDMARVRTLLEQGLASAEHADFVRTLAARSGGKPA